VSILSSLPGKLKLAVFSHIESEKKFGDDPKEKGDLWRENTSV
jgi:hypothetical protein